jgi:Cu(I)/Ag(I) efflux system membrane fusion protein
MDNKEDPSQPPPEKTSTGHKVWAAVRIINVRLRFILLMVIVGVLAAKWETIVDHYDRWQHPPTTQAAAEVEYYCPMHPSVVKDHPGNCPFCGMVLSQRPITTQPASLPAGALARVNLSPRKLELGRVSTDPVEYRLLSNEIRAVGSIDYDQTSQATISARFKGRLDKLDVNYVGEDVKKGQKLAEIYSPELLVAQEELLGASRSLAGAGDKNDFAAQTARSLLASARQKLQLWGLEDRQIDQILQAGQVQTKMDILSPMPGIVTDKKVLEGQYVMEGQELYTVTNLDKVWLQVNIFESDLGYVDKGQYVEVTSAAFPNEIFAGRIAFLAYSVDPATRTLAARIEVRNEDHKLRPGMYMSASIRSPAAAVLTLDPATQPASASAPTGAGLRDEGQYAFGYYCPIYPDRVYDKPGDCPVDKFPMKYVRLEKLPALPESAVIDTGMRKVVYRESSAGSYDMVEVTLGRRSGEFYPVLSGLKVGDRVVAHGAFLVDAENRLNPAAGVQFYGATGSHEHTH